MTDHLRIVTEAFTMCGHSNEMHHDVDAGRRTIVPPRPCHTDGINAFSALGFRFSLLHPLEELGVWPNNTDPCSQGEQGGV